MIQILIEIESIMLFLYYNLFYYYIIFPFIKCKTNGSLEIKYKIDRKFNVIFNRLLAKHGIKKELKNAILTENFSDDKNYHKMKDNLEVTSTYGNLNKNVLSDLDNYKKCYKNRYSKKKGLAKLDCYYEKKVFDKIDVIYEVSRKMKNDKKAFKKKIYKKFGYRLILFALLPSLGLIYPVLFYGGKKAIIPWCGDPNHPKRKNQGDCDIKRVFNKGELIPYDYMNTTISCILSIIVLSAFFYIITKFIKYERIKAGKGKMNKKEHIHFCKNLLKKRKI
ncbi:hypothetical protein PVIIG_05308 [Plasmodium vivax India VII]|uniref:Variable surface protein n=2 Tax=Plasmodium vivax TaxID=5855 RepID=A0A0J9S1T1_PLAVI|nr:hypothetical protein PVIIG_05308 [Plasmodium vivax India VII]KMZ88628.1 hypothetical protein PVBG_04836 [Plasmodium vivax Brazil I]